ncbi:MAG TPA: HIT domain-containing protein [Candidatus Binataceae bacterium]
MRSAPGDAPASAAQVSDAGQRLWAPWRHSYLLTAGAVTKQACIFCLGAINEAARKRLLVLYDDRLATVMLNRYPYNNGHLLIATRRHVATPELLTAAEQAKLGLLMAESVRLLRRELRPAGFNLGANLGRTAGAGFADHMHWHVVPRWDGDNNFMPVLASTRVLSQHLRDSYARLRPVFKTIRADLS